jgi:2-polyprenyl-3-methyl-5-hydroxy-6-metoxy-1,4-benzoquinol methylase
MKHPQELVWTNELIEEFWNFQSQFPENYFANQFGEPLARYLNHKIPPGGDVLDLGCGTGDFLRQLSNGERNLWGSDLSDSSIEIANERCKNVPGFIGAMKTPKLIGISKKFDVITVTEVIEHLYDKELKSLVNDIKRLLKPNGIVVFTTPNNEDLALNYVYCPESRKYFHRWQHVRTWNRLTISEFLSKSNFDKVYCEETNLNWYRKSKGDKTRTLVSNAISKLSKNKPHLIVTASFQ